MIEVYKATSPYGSSCHFGVESTARAWAGTNGTVERIEVREPPVLTVVQKPDELTRLRGEASVMRELLRNCLAVISIAEPLTTDEADALADLNQKIERAIGDAKGTLL